MHFHLISSISNDDSHVGEEDDTFCIAREEVVISFKFVVRCVQDKIFTDQGMKFCKKFQKLSEKTLINHCIIS
jgi:hypothetical protein